MKNERNMLFVTNFSEASFRAIPTLTDWIDREDGQLTILHVHSGGRTEENDARQKMRSFFAEADRYARCERVLLSGEPSRVVLDYCRRQRPALVFAPASHPTGLPRLFHRSIRAMLLKDAGVRIWTRGRNGHALPTRRAPENVAYVITGHANWKEEAHLAARVALRHRSRFHLIHLTPIQDVHDGTLASDIRLGQPNVSTDDLLRLIDKFPVPPLIHSSTGDEIRELPRLLRECLADMVFLGERHAVRSTMFGCSVNPDLEKLDTELICFPGVPAPHQAEQRDPQGYALLPSYIR